MILLQLIVALLAEFHQRHGYLQLAAKVAGRLQRLHTATDFANPLHFYAEYTPLTGKSQENE